MVLGLQARGSGEGIVPSRSEHHQAPALSGRSSFVVVVQPTDFWNFGDFPGLSALDVTWLRTVQVQGEVGAPVVVVAEVALQDRPQVLLAQHDDMVETLSPDTAERERNMEWSSRWKAPSKRSKSILDSALSAGVGHSPARPASSATSGNMGFSRGTTGVSS